MHVHKKPPIIINYYYYSHISKYNRDWQWLISLPNITGLVNSGDGIQPRPSLSASPGLQSYGAACSRHIRILSQYEVTYP